MRSSPAAFLLLGLVASSLRAQDTNDVRTYYDSIRASLPAFDSFPVRAWTGLHPVTPKVSGPRIARMYRTMIREGAAAGPNFAGHFTIVSWGCGSSCQVQAVVDARTGRVFGPTLITSMRADFRLNSALLIADPIDSIADTFGTDTAVFSCAACGTTAAYRWTGAKFVPLGSGPHPHLESPY